MATRDYTVEGAEITPRARTLTAVVRSAAGFNDKVETIRPKLNGVQRIQFTTAVIKRFEHAKSSRIRSVPLESAESVRQIEARLF